MANTTDGPGTSGAALLWYPSPAAGWNEALPVGDGNTGAMAFGGLPLERLQVNDARAWSGSPLSETRFPLPDATASHRAVAAARAAALDGDYAESDAQLRRVQHRYSQSYQPFADIWLRIESTPPTSTPTAAEYRRSLDLGDAVHTVEAKIDGRRIRRTTYVSRVDRVLVAVLESDAPGLDVTIAMGTPLRALGFDRGHDDAALFLRLPSDVAPPVDAMKNPIEYSDEPGTFQEGALVLGWKHDGDAETATGTLEARGTGTGDRDPSIVMRVRGAQRVVLVAATETGFTRMGQAPEGDARSAAAAARDRVRAALSQDEAAMRAGHVAAHRSLFDRVELSVGDPADPSRLLSTDQRLLRAAAAPSALAADPGLAALLVQYGRYLLISSSRPGGVPANLQGIWNHHVQPPWSGNYTTNINVEMNYWAAQTAALPELAEPLWDLVEVLAERGRETAMRVYGLPGWVAHHNTDIWGYTQPVGHGRHDPRWAFWPLAGAWLLAAHREHVLFGADDDFIADRVWAPLRGCAEFLLGWLVELDGDTLGTAPSTSPENVFKGPDGRSHSSAVSSTMDLVLIADTLRFLIDAADRLGQADDPVVAAAQGALPRIPGPGLSRDGGIAEWRGDFPQVELDHRHLSHLCFAYPGDTELTPELHAAVSSSLDGRGDASTGWSLAWKIALRARLGQADAVERLVDLVFTPADDARGDFGGGIYPDLLTAHPPFQIDGNLGYTAGIIEALLQSHAGMIHLLPALPPGWLDGRVRGLRARPGVVVDIEWKHGRLFSAMLAAESASAAGPHRVQWGDASTTVRLGDGPTLLHPSDFGL